MPSTFSSSRLYREAVERLEQVGIANAKQEALWIIEEALGVSRIQIHVNADHVLDSEAYTRTLSLIERRALNEPLQYILGSQEFFGLDMVVNPGVLIPRPESELLVEEAIACLKSHSQPIILDVGTGSGCLAISVAKALPSAVVIGLDRSLSAIQVAKQNVERYGMGARIFLIAGDLLAPLLSRVLAGKVTAIIANLPYISHSEWDRLSPGVKDFEPRLALDGGPDGLDVYRRLLAKASSLLAPEGWVFMEIGLGQADALCKEVAVSRNFEVSKIESDEQRIPRMVCVKHMSFKRQQ